MLRVYCKKEKVKNEIFMELLSRASVTAHPHIMGSQVVGARFSQNSFFKNCCGCNSKSYGPIRLKFREVSVYNIIGRMYLEF